MKKRLFLIITCAFVIMCFMSAGAFAEQSKTDASTDGNTPVAVAQAEGDQQTNGGQATESPPAENQSVTNQLLATQSVANQSTTVYDGSSADKAWQVSTPEELRAALVAGGYISITQDFSFTENWTPVTLTYAVTIDGNNHTLTGLKVTNALEAGNTGKEGGSYSGYRSGLIGTASANITISNLTFADAEINPAKTLGQDETYSHENGFSQAGVIVGYTGKDTTLTNVHIKNSEVTANTKCGLFIGHTGSGTATIKGCSAEDSTVNSSYSYALLVGLTQGTVTIDEATKVKNCSTKFIEGVDFNQANYNGVFTKDGYKTFTIDGYKYVRDPSGSKPKILVLDPNGGWVNSRKNQATINGESYATPDTIIYDGVASINGWEYQSLNAAINSATAGQTIELLKNVTIPDGYVAKQGTDGKYTVELKNPEKVEQTEVGTKTQQGEVAVEVGKGVAVEDKETAKAVASSVEANLNKPETTKEITVSNDDKKTAVQKLVAAGQVKINETGEIVSANGGEVTITIIEEPYLEVEVTEIKTDKDTGKKELKLDITPKYNLLATTATGTTISDADKVTVSTGNALNVEAKTDVKLQLPEGFASDGDKLLVTHTKHDGTVEYLTGKVTKEGDVLYVSFTTTGFSPIVVSDDYAASAGEQVYPTLQAAIDAVKNGETIKLMKNGETAVVRRTVSFTVDPSYQIADGQEGNYTYTITLGDGTTRNKTGNDNEWSTVYTAPAKADTAKTAKSPLTGDNSELGLFAVVGLISAVGVALVLRRKQSN